MNYEIKRSFRKTLAIRVADGKVMVHAPHFVSEARIHAFVLKKQAWIEKRLANYRPLGLDLSQGAILIIFGVLYRVERYPSTVFSFEFIDGVLVLKIPPATSEASISKRVEAHLKSELDDKIKSALPVYCNRLGLAIPEYTIRKYKRMHGRCGSDGKLGFNTYLYHEAPEFIRYVIAHECAHLIEFNHSARFYAVVASIMPHYKSVIAKQKHSQLINPDQ